MITLSLSSSATSLSAHTPTATDPTPCVPLLLLLHLWGASTGVKFGRLGSHPHKRTDGNPHQKKTLFLLEWQINSCRLAPNLQFRQKNVQGRVTEPNVKTQLFFLLENERHNQSFDILLQYSAESSSQAETSSYCILAAGDAAGDRYHSTLWTAVTAIKFKSHVIFY